MAGSGTSHSVLSHAGDPHAEEARDCLPGECGAGTRWPEEEEEEEGWGEKGTQVGSVAHVGHKQDFQEVIGGPVSDPSLISQTTNLKSLRERQDLEWAPLCPRRGSHGWAGRWTIMWPGVMCPVSGPDPLGTWRLWPHGECGSTCSTAQALVSCTQELVRGTDHLSTCPRGTSSSLLARTTRKTESWSLW